MKQTEDKGKCRCTPCNMAFRRLSTFRAHLVGPASDRRHLTAVQLIERGFWQDSKGQWRAKANPNRVWTKKDAA